MSNPEMKSDPELELEMNKLAKSLDEHWPKALDTDRYHIPKKVARAMQVVLQNAETATVTDAEIGESESSKLALEAAVKYATHIDEAHRRELEEVLRLEAYSYEGRTDTRMQEFLLNVADAVGGGESDYQDSSSESTADHQEAA